MFAKSSFRARSFVAAMALSALPLAAALPAQAVEVPATAITENTALVVWLDVTSIDSTDVTTQMLKMQARGGLSEKDKAKMAEMLKAFVDFRTQFVAGGGEGVLFGLAQPAKEGDKPEPFVLVKTKAGADRAKLEAMLHGLAGLAKDNAQASTAIMGAKLEKYGTSTEWHALTGEELVFPPLNGTAKDAAVFNSAFKPGGKAAFQLCFHMLPKMKTDLKAMLDAQAKNPQQGGMMMGMMGGVLAPLADLDTVVMVGDGVKGTRKVDLTAHFGEGKSAKDFAGGANGLIEMGKGMAGMQLAQMAKYGVDTKNANEVLASLVFKDEGNNASLKLDDAFFTKVETFSEQVQAATEKMKAAAHAKAPVVEQGGAEDEE